MPSFKYTGDDARYYPTLGLEVTPGAVADLAEAPTDGRWSAADGSPVPAPAPAVSDLAI
jgi:hypothetical protein